MINVPYRLIYAAMALLHGAKFLQLPEFIIYGLLAIAYAVLAAMHHPGQG